MKGTCQLPATEHSCYLYHSHKVSPLKVVQIYGVTVFNHGLSNREIQLLPEAHLLAIAHIGSAKTHSREISFLREKTAI